MKLSVIIVNYNVRFFLEQCLISVFKAIEGIDAEVFVVDNNSIDGSQSMLEEKFPQAKLIFNTENVGFSRANNQAIELSKGDYVLLLNPDTLLEDDTLKNIVEFADATPDAGGIGVKMIDGKGRFLPESKRSLPTPDVAFYKIFGLSWLFPHSKTFGKYHLTYLDKDKIHKVDVLSGAFMLLRKEALEKTGLLDETFFMYGEDIDLSYRITKAGYSNYYYPQARIIHYKGESTKKSSINYVFVFYRAMVIFATKHFSAKNARLFSILIHSAIYLRATIAVLMRFFKSALVPILDFAAIFSGILLIKNLWQHTMFYHNQAYYPEVFAAIVVPAYILIWLLSVYFAGGYEKPVNIFKSVQGVLAGTFVILVIYALLPESLRFSRALILLGALWAMVAMSLIRWLLHLTHVKDFKIGSKAVRLVIIGSKNEADRIALMLARFNKNPEFMGFVETTKDGIIDKNALGHIKQLNDIIEIYKINEIIFCAADMSYDSIMDKMSSLQNSDVHFKIVPPDSFFIVGSNSIESPDSFWSIDVNAISRKANLRKKYIFDFILAVGLLMMSPLFIFLLRSVGGFFKNLWGVFTGKLTWVGFAAMESDFKFPRLRIGVLTPDEIFNKNKLTPELIANINLMYARNYKVRNDIAIILKNIRNLGKLIKE